MSAPPRQCHECTLCCRLMPVSELHKPANERCTFMRGMKGCAIHQQPTYPRSCRLWSCQWLHGADTQALARPDRSHYVLDMVPDYVELDVHDGGPLQQIMVVQIWLDPRFPNAHRDPALRTWLDERAQRMGQVGLVRCPGTPHDGLVLVLPSLSPNGRWHELASTEMHAQHSAKQVIEVMRAVTGEGP